MMKYLLILSLLAAQCATAQDVSKEDKKTLAGLKTSVNYLADDKLEGRRTGTAGEKLAYEFISAAFKKTGLAPKGDNNSFIQAFEVNEGKELKEDNSLNIPGAKMILNEDYFPMPFSAIGTADLSTKAGKKNIYLLEINGLISQNKDNPHFDLREGIISEIKDLEKKGVEIVFLRNADAKKEEEHFDAKDKTPSVGIPVFYITSNGMAKYLAAERELENLSSAR